MPLLSAEPEKAAPGISAESAAEMRKARDPADLEKILRDLNMKVRARLCQRPLRGRSRFRH